MNIEIKDMPAMRVASVCHTGPYNQIHNAFERLGNIASRAGLIGKPGSIMIAIYHDDPETTPADQLRSDAGITVAESAQLPADLEEKRLSAGRYATTVHRGPYEQLPDAWARLMGEWLPASGNTMGSGDSYEVYINNPMTVPKEHLETALYIPITA